MKGGVSHTQPVGLGTAKAAAGVKYGNASYAHLVSTAAYKPSPK